MNYFSDSILLYSVGYRFVRQSDPDFRVCHVDLH